MYLCSCSQQKMRSRWAVVLGFYLLFLSVQLWAVACDVIFSNAIQTTSATGNINLKFHSILSGGGATLKTKTLTDNTAWVACSGASCVASGTAATTSTPTFVTGTGSDGAINVAASGSANKTSGDYATVVVNNFATLNFTSANGTFKTQSFTTNYLSVVTLKSGDYWINGNLTIGQETLLKRISSSGSTRIFVNGNVSFGFRVATQSFTTTDQLLIYATGTITSANEVKLSAFLYAAGNVNLGFQTVIDGAVSGANFISGGNEVGVNYTPSALVSADFSPFCSGAGPDHYELQIAAGSLACLGADVTVRACANSAVPCTQDSSVNKNVSLATTVGSLNATTLTLSGGSATTKLFYPAAIDGANATVTLSGEQTAATNSRKCCTGSSSCSVANSCTTQFKTAGFEFTNSATGLGAIANQVAGDTGNNVYIRALQSDKTTGACTSRFTSPQNIPLAYQCRNPTTCIAGEVLTLNGNAISSNANSAGPIVYSGFSYANVPLSFDANGSAAIPFVYSDVGQLRLHANLSLAATATDPAYTLSGTSSDFIVAPKDLKITSVKTSVNVLNPATTQAGAGFVASGTAFKVDVQAYSSATPAHVTPNFGKETTPQTVELLLNSLVSPAGGNMGALTNADAFTLASTTFTNSTISWSDVGTIALKAHIKNADYLGAGDVTSIAAVNVGRFYPDHFALMSSSTANSCGSFSYLGQPSLGLTYQLRAENLSNALVSNYAASYSPTLAQPVYFAENANDGVDLSSRVSMTTSSSWVSGLLDITTLNPATTVAVNRQASTAPDGPFASLQLGLNVTDALDARTLKTTSLNMNPTNNVNCSSNTSCTAVTLGSTLALRYGRLRLDDAFGPETVKLPVNFLSEYWIGNYFALNASDSCTVVPRAAVTYPSGSLAVDANRTVALSSGNTQGTYNNIDAAGIHFNAGSAGHFFTAPSTAGTGSFTVGINLTNLSWLRFDWNQDGNFSDTSLPNAQYGFGSYRGNDRIIYWREKL